MTIDVTAVIILLIVVVAPIAIIIYLVNLIVRLLKAKIRETELKNKFAEQQLRE